MHTPSTAFSSLTVRPHTREGINGALTPARRHRHSSSGFRDTNDENPAGSVVPSEHSSRYHSNRAAVYSTTNDQRKGHRNQRSHVYRTSTDRLAGGEGVSLQETEARIEYLERNEFDLKMKLFYTEERLEEAAGGADAVQLHREIANAKRHRAQAEQAAREGDEALAGLESTCRDLEAKMRDVEAKAKADREEDAEQGRLTMARLKKHVSLLEDTLRVERAENARLRVATNSHRSSWGDLSDRSSNRSVARRKSTGADGRGQVDLPSRSGYGREQRERYHQFAAKVRSQDSLLRSLRADVTTMRRRLRTQGEVLSRQKDENEVVRRAAEQVACVEAEEIARLAVDLERAVRTAKGEAEKRRDAEDRLAVAERYLLESKSDRVDDVSDNRRNGYGHSPPSVSPRSRSPMPSPSPRGVGNGSCGAVANYATRANHRPRVSAARDHAEKRSVTAAIREEAAINGYDEEETRSPRRSGVLGSTIASRGRRSVHDSKLGDKGRWLSSPRGNPASRVEKIRRRPWGTSPSPSPHRQTALTANGTGATSSRRRSAGESKSPPVRHHEVVSADNPSPKRSGSAERSRSGVGNGDVGVGRNTSSRGTADIVVAAISPGSVTTGGQERKVGFPLDTEAGLDDSAMMAEAVAAAIDGADLTATIARELRSAVATASSSSPSAAVGFDRGGLKDSSPIDDADGWGRTRQGLGGEVVSPKQETGAPKVWNTPMTTVNGDLATTVARALMGIEGRALKSKQVLELEGDIQHVFQFFAAKDRGAQLGQRSSPSKTERDDDEDFSESSTDGHAAL